MLKWFSISGIIKEVKGKIRWPKLKELFKDTKTVLLFIIVFALFFILADIIVLGFLKLIGLGA